MNVDKTSDFPRLGEGVRFAEPNTYEMARTKSCGRGKASGRLREISPNKSGGPVMCLEESVGKPADV